MVAFRASMLVCCATPEIMVTMPPIRSTEALRSATCWIARAA
jgi:hypothetical protein